MSPLIERDDVAPLVGPFTFNYGRAFLIVRFLGSNCPQPKIQLQRIVHYGRATALLPPSLSLL
jgi:hypothetical protein